MLSLLVALLAPPQAAALTTEEILAEIHSYDSYRSQRLAAAPRIPDTAYTSAANGNVYRTVLAAEGSETGKAYGVAISSLGIEGIWKAINDEPHLVGYMPISDSAVISGTARASNVAVFQYLDIPVPGVADRWWITKVKFNSGMFASSSRKLWELYWQEDFTVSLEGTAYAAKAAEGIPITYSKGAWLLIPLSDGRTVMEYYVWSNPGGSVPTWVASKLGGGAIEETIRGVERMVREHIPSCGSAYYYPDGSRMP